MLSRVLISFEFPHIFSFTQWIWRRRNDEHSIGELKIFVFDLILIFFKIIFVFVAMMNGDLIMDFYFFFEVLDFLSEPLTKSKYSSEIRHNG